MTTQYQQTGQGAVPVGVSMLLAASGVFLSNPTLVAVAMAPLVFVAASAVTTVPSVDSVRVARAVTPQQTYPGGTATVELTVTNDGDQSLSDLRIIDGVPDALGVVSGSPRAAVQLETGESATLTYTVRLQHGEHSFTPVTLRAQELSSTRCVHTEQEPSGDTAVAARVGVEGSPLPDAGAAIAGALPTDSGGEGLEFYGIRSYNPGDPVTRINWRQYARERTLSTVEYRRQEATTVIIIVDVRPSTWVAPTATTPTGAESAVQAAAEAAHSLVAAQHQVGLAVLSSAHPDASDGWVWLPPGNSQTARNRFQTVLDAAATSPADNEPPDETTPPEIDSLRQYIRQASQQAQIILFSPLTDDYPVKMCTTLRKAEYHCQVYAPDVSAQGSLGAMVETTAHRLRMQTLRAQGVPVTAWPCDQPLSQAVASTDHSQNTTDLNQAKQ